MPFDPQHPYQSLNKETGLLEDIDELRDVARRMALFIKVIAHMGLLEFAFSPSAIYDIACSMAMLESMAVPTSQADFQRTMGLILGASPEYIEQIIKQNNLSEVFPATSPDATPVDISNVTINPDDPTVKGSFILSHLIEEFGSQMKQPPTKDDGTVEDIEPVQLPKGMEDFLIDVLGTVEGEQESDPGSDGNSGSETP